MLKIRAALNGKSETKISINDFVIRTAALALRQVPRRMRRGATTRSCCGSASNIAVAVALDDGLITPIVKGADQKGLAQIAAETKDLASRARAGKLKLEEFQGGTFSISKSRDVRHPRVRRGDQPAAWLHPRGRRRRAAPGRAGRPAGGRDRDDLHAVVRPSRRRRAVGAQFLAAFKKLIEDPLTMLL